MGIPNRPILVAVAVVLIVAFAAAGLQSSHNQAGSSRKPISASNGASNGNPPCIGCEQLPIRVGGLPTGFSFDAQTGNLAVGNYRGTNLSIINGTTNQVVRSISVGLSPRDLTFDPSNGYLYVDVINPSTGEGDTMAVVNPVDGSVVHSISLPGNDPISPCFDTDNGLLYVPEHLSSDVLVLNPSNFSVVASIPVGAYPGSAACDAENGEVYVTNQDSDSVSVIGGSNNSLIDTIELPVNTGPYSSALATNAGELYVGDVGTTANDYKGDLVSVIDTATNTLTGTVSVGSEPIWLCYDSASDSIYASSVTSDTVTSISVDTGETQTVALGLETFAVVFDAANGHVYASDYYAGSVSELPESS